MAKTLINTYDIFTNEKKSQFCKKFLEIFMGQSLDINILNNLLLIGASGPVAYPKYAANEIQNLSSVHEKYGVYDEMFDSRSLGNLFNDFKKHTKEIDTFIGNLKGKWVFRSDDKDSSRDTSFNGFLSRFVVGEYIGNTSIDSNTIGQKFAKLISILDSLSSEKTKQGKNYMKGLEEDIRNLVTSSFVNLKLKTTQVTPFTQHSTSLLIPHENLKIIHAITGLEPFPKDTSMKLQITECMNVIIETKNKLTEINNYLIGKGVYKTKNMLDELEISDGDVKKYFLPFYKEWLNPDEDVLPPVKYTPVEDFKNITPVQRRYIEAWTLRRISDQNLGAIAYVLYNATRKKNRKSKMKISAAEAFRWLREGEWHESFVPSLNDLTGPKKAK